MSFAASMYRPSDIELLISNVVNREYRSEGELIEAIPVFLSEMSPTEVKKSFIPFIINWVDFGVAKNAKRLVQMLPNFFRLSDSHTFLTSFLFPINELIRQNTIFIEESMMDLCRDIINIYDSTIIEHYLIPSLDRLFGQENIDAQGIALRMQAFLCRSLQSKWKEIIVERAISLSSINSTYLHICILNAVPDLMDIAEMKDVVLSSILRPNFTFPDFKVRNHAIKITADIAPYYFQYMDDLDLIAEFSEESSWGTRFAFAENAPNIIQYVKNKESLASALVSLCRDPINEVRSIALTSLANCVQFVPKQCMKSIPTIFDSGMRAKTEEIRNATILLWSKLIQHYPDAPFHDKLLGALSLLTVVPIESFAYQMMKLIIPLIPASAITTEMLTQGFETIFRAKDRPQTVLMAIDVARSFVKIPHLLPFAVSLAPRFVSLLAAPVLAHRLAAGCLLIDYTLVLGWEWACEVYMEPLDDVIRGRDGMAKASALRTIAGMMCCDPPDEMRGYLTEMLDIAAADKTECVALCLAEVRQRIDSVL